MPVTFQQPKLSKPRAASDVAAPGITGSTTGTGGGGSGGGETSTTSSNSMKNYVQSLNNKEQKRSSGPMTTGDNTKDNFLSSSSSSYHHHTNNNHGARQQCEPLQQLLYQQNTRSMSSSSKNTINSDTNLDIVTITTMSDNNNDSINNINTLNNHCNNHYGTTAGATTLTCNNTLATSDSDQDVHTMSTSHGSNNIITSAQTHNTGQQQRGTTAAGPTHNNTGPSTPHNQNGNCKSSCNYYFPAASSAGQAGHGDHHQSSCSRHLQVGNMMPTSFGTSSETCQQSHQLQQQGNCPPAGFSVCSSHPQHVSHSQQQSHNNSNETHGRQVYAGTTAAAVSTTQQQQLNLHLKSGQKNVLYVF